MSKEFLALVVGFLIAASAVATEDVSIQADEPDTGTIQRTNDPRLAEVQDLWRTAKAAGNLDTFVTAAESAGLENQLRAPGPRTIFAPSDSAFAKIDKGKLDALLHPDNSEQLRQLLLDHIVEGEVQLEGSDGATVTAASGKSWTVKRELRGLVIGNAVVEKPDVPATNGTIHIVDRVLMLEK